MTSFKYAAKKPTGQTVEGMIQADDRGQAVAELRRQNLVVLRLDAAAASAAPRAPRFAFFYRSPRVTNEELVLFTRQLSTMVGAGLALLESIDVLGEQAETPGLRTVCAQIGADLRSGSDLSSAMERCPRAFSPLYVSMVRAGEASGQMDVILARLADYLESSQALKREIKAAMTYPVISLVLVISITAFLMLGVVPTFRQVFEGLGTELPALTQFTLDTSEWLKNNWYVVVGGAFGAFAGFTLLKQTPRGALLFDHVALRAPVFGPIARKVALARFSRTFATLIRSGVPIMGTLDIVADTAGNRVIANTVAAAKESVRNGQLLSDPLAQSSVFPPMVTRMIAIGERTGSLEQLLEKIAEFYDAQVKAAIKSLTSLIEPLLITFMGVIVGGVVLSVFLPILDVVGKLSGPS
ncbi:MAG: type II secretion system F family protein [Planctomycetota bacterium]